MSLAESLPDPDALIARLAEHDYLAEAGLATALFCAVRLPQPLLLEGEAGVGKTQAAKALASLLDTPLIRLQCFEGIDASEALYEWNYPRQLLGIRLAEAQGSHLAEDALFSRDFLIDRPLLQAQTIERMFRIESGDDSRVMGLCWNAQRREGRELLWGHGGSDPGINANLRLRFADGVAAIVLMNTNVGRPPLPAPLEFAEYLMDHSSALLARDQGSA